MGYMIRIYIYRYMIYKYTYHINWLAGFLPSTVCCPSFSHHAEWCNLDSAESHWPGLLFPVVCFFQHLGGMFSQNQTCEILIFLDTFPVTLDSRHLMTFVEFLFLLLPDVEKMVRKQASWTTICLGCRCCNIPENSWPIPFRRYLCFDVRSIGKTNAIFNLYGGCHTVRMWQIFFKISETSWRF